MSALDLADWTAQVSRWKNVVVLTGAGCSVASGIPAYRDATGQWRHRAPVTYQRFTSEPGVRRRYWARSFVGWPRVAAAQPNASHQALAQLERLGLVRVLVTQNVDGLHGRAGSERVIELHGDLATVRCLGCGWRGSRAQFQQALMAENPTKVAELSATQAPDGDAQLAESVYETFHVPDCHSCGGLLKPDVVFFGEAVPAERVEAIKVHIATCDAVLVAGSSLTVFSGFRFVKLAAQRHIPIAVVNLGRTRADAFGALHLQAPSEQALPALAKAAAQLLDH